jgi:hypothetical protein
MSSKIAANIDVDTGYAQFFASIEYVNVHSFGKKPPVARLNADICRSVSRI